jgi:hypothetical protein
MHSCPEWTIRENHEHEVNCDADARSFTLLDCMYHVSLTVCRMRTRGVALLEVFEHVLRSQRPAPHSLTRLWFTEDLPNFPIGRLHRTGKTLSVHQWTFFHRRAKRPSQIPQTGQV